MLFRLIPTGWFAQNKVSIGRMHTDYLRPMVDADKRVVLPERSRHTSAAIASHAARVRPYDLFSSMLLPALERSAQKTAFAQSYVDLARRYAAPTMGAVLITQQPGSIPNQILSQGDNWFVFHLLSWWRGCAVRWKVLQNSTQRPWRVLSLRAF